jgi:hypothetical protein
MRPRSSPCSYNGSRSTVAVRAVAAVLLTWPALAGCSAISIPLGNLTGGERRPAPETTASIAPVPTQRVTAEPLAPLAAPATPQAQPHPVVTSTRAPAEARPAERPPSPLSEAELDSVTATLALALLDQERGATVPWLDQRSGSGGTITPVGSPARQADTVCRAVLVSVQRGRDTSLVQGNACRGGESWSLSDVRPFRNPA